MIFPTYLESIKEIFKSKKKSNESNDLDDFSVSCDSYDEERSKKDKKGKRLDDIVNDTVIYETIKEDSLRSCFSKSVLTFKSSSSSLRSKANESLNRSTSSNVSTSSNESKLSNQSVLSSNRSTLTNESTSPKRFTFSQSTNQSVNRNVYNSIQQRSIDHECIETKVVRTKLNQNNHEINEQKCIHQSHPECLDLSTSDEGCLVCNALILGRKNEILTSFKAKTSKQDQPVVKQQRSLLNELTKLVRAGYYHGKLSRFEAEDKLINTQAGTFLIRDSFDTNYILSLSFRINEGVFHTRIEYRAGYFHFYLHPHKKYETVSELVDDLIECSKTGIYYYIKSKKTGEEIRFEIKLDKPLSRFNQIRSLKYLCRFVIKQNIRYDQIQDLKVPDSIKEYLVENHF